MEEIYLDKQKAIEYILSNIDADTRNVLTEFFSTADINQSPIKAQPTAYSLTHNEIKKYNDKAKARKSHIKLYFKDIAACLGARYNEQYKKHIRMSKEQFLLNISWQVDRNLQLHLDEYQEKQLVWFAKEDQVSVFEFLLKNTNAFLPKVQVLVGDYVKRTVQMIQAHYGNELDENGLGPDISGLRSKDISLYNRVRHIRLALYPDLPILYTITKVLKFKYSNGYNTSIKIDENKIADLVTKRYINNEQLTSYEDNVLKKGVFLISIRDNISTSEVYARFGCRPKSTSEKIKRMTTIFEYMTKDLHEKIHEEHRNKQLEEARNNPDSYINKVDERGILLDDVVIYVPPKETSKRRQRQKEQKTQETIAGL